jgi:hypothetical protein
MNLVRDLHDAQAALALLEAQDLAYTDTLSGIIDTAAWKSMMILVAIGALTGVDGSNSLLPILQESDTTATGDFTTVAAADVVGAFTLVDAASEDSVLQRVSYVGSKRYVRVKLDYTGTGISAGIVGVYAIPGLPSSEPAATPTVTATT